ncbi:putative rrna processing [Phaeomoniella chlamydospora]|uniref:Putative rrna processing n=1 Tax=Phaeomoniella chlamydospora TaxID=158046 RepID=A0A0G2GD08_PHACM|nr:putative rrna processing [Phaeomoniella chlamydospora]
MRAKRSKKYRKIIQQYELNFGFREAYQVLVDTNFLLAIRAFQMPLQASLERTLHGKVKPFITKCCLEAANARSLQSNKTSPSPSLPKYNPHRRPTYIPSPLELPLRHCDHGDRGILSETECLLDLVSGGASSTILNSTPKGQGKQPKNKEHYIIATGDAEAGEKIAPISNAGQKRKRHLEERDMRALIREVPGVPIIYVKRSVMILEELSAASLGVRRKEEKEKMTEGLLLGKRKRDEELDSDDNEDETQSHSSKSRGLRKAKGPNPLSVKKKKKGNNSSSSSSVKSKSHSSKSTLNNHNAKENQQERERENEEDKQSKPKRRRKHKKSSTGNGTEVEKLLDDTATAGTIAPNVPIEA